MRQVLLKILILLLMCACCFGSSNPLTPTKNQSSDEEDLNTEIMESTPSKRKRNLKTPSSNEFDGLKFEESSPRKNYSFRLSNERSNSPRLIDAPFKTESIGHMGAPLPQFLTSDNRRLHDQIGSFIAHLEYKMKYASEKKKIVGQSETTEIDSDSMFLTLGEKLYKFTGVKGEYDDLFLSMNKETTFFQAREDLILQKMNKKFHLKVIDTINDFADEQIENIMCVYNPHTINDVLQFPLLQKHPNKISVWIFDTNIDENQDLPDDLQIGLIPLRKNESKESDENHDIENLLFTELIISGDPHFVRKVLSKPWQRVPALIIYAEEDCPYKKLNYDACDGKLNYNLLNDFNKNHEDSKEWDSMLVRGVKKLSIHSDTDIVNWSNFFNKLAEDNTIETLGVHSITALNSIDISMFRKSLTMLILQNVKELKGLKALINKTNGYSMLKKIVCIGRCLWIERQYILPHSPGPRQQNMVLPTSLMMPLEPNPFNGGIINQQNFGEMGNGMNLLNGHFSQSISPSPYHKYAENSGFKRTISGDQFSQFTSPIYKYSDKTNLKHTYSGSTAFGSAITRANSNDPTPLDHKHSESGNFNYEDTFDDLVSGGIKLEESDSMEAEQGKTRDDVLESGLTSLGNKRWTSSTDSTYGTHTKVPYYRFSTILYKAYVDNEAHPLLNWSNVESAYVHSFSPPDKDQWEKLLDIDLFPALGEVAFRFNFDKDVTVKTWRYAMNESKNLNN